LWFFSPIGCFSPSVDHLALPVFLILMAFENNHRRRLASTLQPSFEGLVKATHTALFPSADSSFRSFDFSPLSLWRGPHPSVFLIAYFFS